MPHIMDLVKKIIMNGKDHSKNKVRHLRKNELHLYYTIKLYLAIIPFFKFNQHPISLPVHFIFKK
jgi:hypothetical protein